MASLRIEDLTYQELRHMSKSDLKSLVSTSAKRLNQRAYRVEKAGSEAYQGAVQQMKESGGRFHAPSTKKELLKEATRERQFARNPSSRVRVAKDIMSGATKDLKTDYVRDQVSKGKSRGEAEQEFKDRTAKAWEQFHKKKEENPAIEYSKADIKNRVNQYAETGRGINKVKNFYDSYFEEFEDEDNEEWTAVSDSPFTVI